MEIILTLAVVLAVIIFGALISVGNDRQRTAIDGLREQVVLWAMQDLRMKREKLAREIKIDDPLVWLNQIVAKVYGEPVDLDVTEIVENPQTLVCMGKDGQRIVMSLFSLKDFQRLKQKKKNKLSQVGNIHPLADMPKNVDQLEISILNGGLLFDLELQIAWSQLVGNRTVQGDKLFLYVS